MIQYKDNIEEDSETLKKVTLNSIQELLTIPICKTFAEMILKTRYLDDSEELFDLSRDFLIKNKFISND
jgi:hypothetical protein